MGIGTGEMTKGFDSGHRACSFEKLKVGSNHFLYISSNRHSVRSCSIDPNVCDPSVRRFSRSLLAIKTRGPRSVFASPSIFNEEAVVKSNLKPLRFLLLYMLIECPDSLFVKHTDKSCRCIIHLSHLERYGPQLTQVNVRLFSTGRVR